MIGKMAKILLIETAANVCSAAIAVDGTPISLVETRNTLDHAALLTLHIQECVKQSGIPLAALDAVAVSGGPGSYTSLRVGASVAKGICYALEKPLIAVNTLEALAYAGRQWVEDEGWKIEGRGSSVVNNPEPARENPLQAFPGNPATPSAFHLPSSTFFVPMLEARRQEVWTAIFDASLARVSPDMPLVLENNMFAEFVQLFTPNHNTSKFYIFGNGMDKAKKGFLHKAAAFCQVEHTSAAYLANLAEKAHRKGEFQNISYFEPFYMKPPNITTPGKIF